MRKFAFVIMTILLMISFVACSTGSDLPGTEEGSLTENSMQDTGHADVEGNPPAESDAQDAERIEPESDGGEADTPSVYFTSDISPEGLMEVYKALGVELTGKVAVKISTGEPPASNYLRPELIADLVQHVEGTIVECITAYGGTSRNELAEQAGASVSHLEKIEAGLRGLGMSTFVSL